MQFPPGFVERFPIDKRIIDLDPPTYEQYYLYADRAKDHCEISSNLYGAKDGSARWPKILLVGVVCV